MKLLNMKILGFKEKNRVINVDFSEDNISVLYGKNGCGKTTLLNIINAVLTKDESVLLDNNVEKISLKLVNDKSFESILIEKKQERCVKDEEAEYDEKYEEIYDWEQLESSLLSKTSSLSLGVNRGNVKYSRTNREAINDFFRHTRKGMFYGHNVNTSRLAEDLYHFLRREEYRSRRRNEWNLEKEHVLLKDIKMENIEDEIVLRFSEARRQATSKIQSALFDTLAEQITLENFKTGGKEQTLDLADDFLEKLSINKKRIVEALNDGTTNVFKNKVISILDSLEDEENRNNLKKNFLLKKLFFNILNELDEEKMILNSINLLVDTFNEYLIDNKELVVNEHSAYIQKGSMKHRFDSLSSGERHILTLLSLALFEGGKRNFLIIDEPEISLNIAWQRKLMPLLNELIPDTQIIVASHSPAIVGSNQKRLVEITKCEWS